MNVCYKYKIVVFTLLIACTYNLSALKKPLQDESACIENENNSFITTPLHEMVVKQFHNKEQKLKEIKKLLDGGADVNARNEDRRTPLWLATFYGVDTQVIDLLIRYGANVTLPDIFNVTPLHNTVTRNNMVATQLLLDAGAGMKSNTVEKMILFKDDIKGAAVLVEFLKKLDL